MSEVIKCDRCGKMIDKHGSYFISKNGIMLADFDRRYSPFEGGLVDFFRGEYDLCKDCYMDFLKFMKEKKKAQP